MENFHKVVRIGRKLPWSNSRRRVDVFCWIEFYDGSLTISGVVGPRESGNCAGGCGQMQDELAGIDQFAAGWNRKILNTFYFVWENYHLNNMQSACEHQQRAGWTFKTHEGQKCPVCDYQIGNDWRGFPVPQDVLDFLLSLPEADKPCPWSHRWHADWR